MLEQPFCVVTLPDFFSCNFIVKHLSLTSHKSATESLREHLLQITQRFRWGGVVGARGGAAEKRVEKRSSVLRPPKQHGGLELTIRPPERLKFVTISLPPSLRHDL